MLPGLAAIPAVFAALLLRTDHWLIASLRKADALAPATAIPLDLPNPLARWRLARLVQVGAIGSTAAGHVFLNAARWAAYRRRRRRRLLLTLATIVPLVAALVWALGKHMVGWLRSNTTMKVVLKGIVTREDSAQRSRKPCIGVD